MAKLTIVIVNYNVRYFLEQCLRSVRLAAAGMDHEVFVVDNASTDNSCQMVREAFPEVRLIANRSNVGFSRANNQALRQATGQYALLLNPDTIVREDTFARVVAFMDTHPDAGGLGVRMIDGAGRFLPESKRGLPTPMAAFYKIFGLSALFPRSRRFGQYHLSYLDPGQTHQVDVLSGAFMLLRKETLDKIGLLDEQFFMYGEDIDLSYRITLGGYKNYYYAGTTIVHYKGESTKKQSVDYVKVFYNAMQIFFEKHYRRRASGLLSLAVRFAIRLRALLAIAKRLAPRVAVPAADAALLWGFYRLALPMWESLKFGHTGAYPASYLTVVVPIYIAVMLACVLYSGGYDRPYRARAYYRGVAVGAGIILLFYSLLSEDLRFSRAMLVFAAGFAALALPPLRKLYGKIGVDGYRPPAKQARTLLVGTPDDQERVARVMARQTPPRHVTGRVNDLPADAGRLGATADLADICRVHGIDRVVFCPSTATTAQTIDWMMSPALQRVTFSISSPDGVALIGSNSIQTGEPLYSVEISGVGTPVNRRAKRTLDLALSLALLATYPLGVWAVRPRRRYAANLAAVAAGRKSFVGYAPGDTSTLPPLRPGVLAVATPAQPDDPEAEAKTNAANRIYAKNWSLGADLRVIARGWGGLGR